jgi:hypothetical protein
VEIKTNKIMRFDEKISQSLKQVEGPWKFGRIVNDFDNDIGEKSNYFTAQLLIPLDCFENNGKLNKANFSFTTIQLVQQFRYRTGFFCHFRRH